MPEQGESPGRGNCLFAMNKSPENSVAVIIPTCGSNDDYLNCLRSLSQQTYTPLEVILVTNSIDGNLWESVRVNFPHVKLVMNNENLLFAKSQNIGINLTKGELILCLNDDVELEPLFITKLVEALTLYPKAGMACGKVLRQDKKTIDTTGLFLGKSRKPVERGYGTIDIGRYNKAEYIFGAAAVAVLFKREMLEDIKLNGEYFDEDFQIFYEDLDLSWRANLLGWKAYYVPGAVAYHVRGGTAKSKKPKFKFLEKYNFSWLPRELKTHLVKNRYMAMIKNDTLPDFLLTLPFIICYELKLWGYVLLFEPYLIRDTIKNLKYFKSAYNKRKTLREKIKCAKKS
ncbi:MAG: glycosyltransferase family 2 protein [Candidatus Omnitrophota bacterium]